MFGIKNDIQSCINKFGLGDQMEAYMVCKYGQDLMADLCSNQLYCPRVVKYLKTTQTLEVKMKNFVVGQQLRAKDRDIIAGINGKMGGSFVSKIRYRMG